MKIFQIDEETWYAAETIDEAIKAYTNDTGITHEELLQLDEGVDALYELDEEEMNELYFTDVECEFSPDRQLYTFAEALELMILRGDKFPEMFASTEY